jgi:hypothetical protein
MLADLSSVEIQAREAFLRALCASAVKSLSVSAVYLVLPAT